MMSGMKILGGLLLAAVLFAAPAHADSSDQSYIDTLTTSGVGCHHGFDCADGDQTMVQIGHAICKELDSGRTDVSVEAQIMRSKPGFGSDQAAALVAAAQQFYCPSAGLG
jgi:hypothetical protein